MGSKLSCAFCVASLAVIGDDAFAADMLVKSSLDPRPWINPILVANTQVGLGIVAQGVDYFETVPAFPRLDSETGWIPGLQLSVSAMAPIGPVSSVYMMAAFTWLRGDTAYAAATGLVTADRSGADVKALDLRFGKGFDIATSWMLTPYVGAGYRGWDRNLGKGASASGYRELYEHTYVGGGLMAQWAASDRLVLSASGLIGTTLSPRMSISYNGGVPTDPFTFRLGRSTIYMAGLSADYAMTEEWHANGGVDYTSFRYGVSPAAPDGSFEPDSRTSAWTIKAGVGYSLYRSTTQAAQ